MPLLWSGCYHRGGRCCSVGGLFSAARESAADAGKCMARKVNDTLKASAQPSLLG